MRVEREHVEHGRDVALALRVPHVAADRDLAVGAASGRGASARGTGTRRGTPRSPPRRGTSAARRHRPGGLLGQHRDERVDVAPLQRPRVALDERADALVAERAQRGLLALVREPLVDGLARALQRAVDGRRRVVSSVLGDLLRREAEHLAQDQHRALRGGQVLERRDERQLDALALLVARLRGGVALREAGVGVRLDPDRLGQRLRPGSRAARRTGRSRSGARASAAARARPGTCSSRSCRARCAASCGPRSAAARARPAAAPPGASPRRRGPSRASGSSARAAPRGAARRGGGRRPRRPSRAAAISSRSCGSHRRGGGHALTTLDGLGAMSSARPPGLHIQNRNEPGGERDGADDRQEPLDRALRAVRGDADDRARRHRRERRAAVDPGRPRLLAVEPRLGRERLSDRVRRPAAAVRALRRHPRAQERLPRRARRLHRRIAAVRRARRARSCSSRPASSRASAAR